MDYTIFLLNGNDILCFKISKDMKVELLYHLAYLETRNKPSNHVTAIREPWNYFHIKTKDNKILKYGQNVGDYINKNSTLIKQDL